MVFNMKSFILFIMVLCLAFLVGCGGQGDKTTTEIITTTESEAVTMNQSLGYEQITGAEAKMLMDTEGDYIIIDARTTEEFDEGHIEGAILIPEYEIGNRAENELPRKDQLILVYCRSGRRSKIAAEALVDLGYTNVKEFGGIIDWE
mgnify:FL=1|jgi:rhodanese-related sulfurtransferase